VRYQAQGAACVRRRIGSVAVQQLGGTHEQDQHDAQARENRTQELSLLFPSLPRRIHDFVVWLHRCRGFQRYSL
jgi:hypothetical protein